MENWNQKLITSAKTGKEEDLKLCIANEADINYKDDGRTALIEAAVHGHLEVTQLLLDRGCDKEATDDDGWTALIGAAVHGHLEVTQLLLDRGCNKEATNDDGSTALIEAAVHGHLEVTQLLLDRGCNKEATNDDGSTALIEAAWHGHLEVTQLLIDRGCDKEATKDDGSTVLMFAAERGCLEVARLLIDRGCDIDATSKSHAWTALKYAAKGGHLELTQLLLDRGCYKEATDGKVGRTALMWAAWNGHLDVTQLLIDRGCNKEATIEDGRTALHYAAEEGRLEVTKCILALGGISPLVRTHQDKTPYDLAAARPFGQNRKVMEFLQEVSESIFTKLKQLDRNDFPDLVAQGTFASYENRVYLAGPCNIGKSSLASILIGEAIPEKWFSTDGLIIHFGRNGIDLQHRKMIPLKKGSGDVLTKLILGNPELNEQQRLLDEFQKKQNDDERKGDILSSPKSNLTKNENQLNQSNTDQFHSSQQQPKKNVTSSQTPSVQHPQMQLKSDLDISRGLKQPIHTAHSIQDDLLEKIRKGSYMMNIAPSDLVDFGGQKSFDMTHQLFVQHKGTFILMFDGRKGLHTELEEYPQGDVTAASILEHWINSVLTYCTKSEDKMPRITFAATHSDKFSEDEKEKLAISFQEELTERFSSHKFHQHIMYKKVFFINATDKEDLDIDRLKDTLVDIAFQQSTWGQQMPIVWVPLDLQISDMRADGVKLITKEKLLEINKSNKEFALNERRLEDFLLVQHSIGKLLYFDEPALRDFIVIQPTAMVNILRAFITDRMFWPENVTIRDILENLSSTGVLPRKDLLTLWSQPAFEDIMVNDRIKDYVMHVLVHLDILVEPKRYIEKDTAEYLYTRKDTAAVLDTQTENTAAALFLVPCIVKSKIPQQMLKNATDKRTICITYHLKDTVVPSALAFKLIAASISIWPLKIVDKRFCLYFQAAVMDLDYKNELQIHVEGQRIIVNLTNEESKQHISPDLATTIQECLTLALGRILQFYSRCFGKQSHQIMSDLFEIEVGEVCSGKTCLIPLSDAKKQTHWKCKNGKTHDTKYPLNWFFDKNKDQCDPNCEGLEKETKMLLLKPIDQHYVHLAKKLGIGDFYDFFIHLGMAKADYDNLNFRYFSNPMDMMLMGMFQWRDKTNSGQDPATFGKLQKALSAIDRQHYLCQIHREDHSLVEKAHIRLQEVPSDDVINALTEQNLIGDCVVHFGIELGLSIVDIRKTMYKFPRDLDGQIHDLLIKWNKRGIVKPTIYRLMVALKRVEAAEGLAFVKKTYEGD